MSVWQLETSTLMPIISNLDVVLILLILWSSMINFQLFFFKFHKTNENKLAFIFLLPENYYKMFDFKRKFPSLSSTMHHQYTHSLNFILRNSIGKRQKLTTISKIAMRVSF